MNGPIRHFTAAREGEAFTIALLEGQAHCGAYLAPEYLQRLERVIAATRARLTALGNPAFPDALKELLATLDQLLAAHREQQSGSQPSTYNDIGRAQRELLEAIGLLKDGDGPQQA